jgi:adenylylsulfate reductase subunit A
LKWVEEGGPSTKNVEIKGSEPYVVGGHAGAGFWVSTKRETTINGLFAAGDVAGGCPQKYVTGAMAEGYIAAENIHVYLASSSKAAVIDEQTIAEYIKQEQNFLEPSDQLFSAENIEEGMQSVMDEYAGGITTAYRYNMASLVVADKKIQQLTALAQNLKAANMHELLSIHEILDRLLICRFLIAHLQNRKETRWRCFSENTDYPEIDETFNKYVNSYMKDGKIYIKLRPIVTREQNYEHTY